MLLVLMSLVRTRLKYLFSVSTACDCNPAGSIDLQCDRDTGSCHCKGGHLGAKCDMCAVDTTGKMPKCEICGECYYTWKGTLSFLAKNVTLVIHRASNLSVSGSGKSS